MEGPDATWPMDVEVQSPCSHLGCACMRKICEAALAIICGLWIESGEGMERLGTWDDEGMLREGLIQQAIAKWLVLSKTDRQEGEG